MILQEIWETFLYENNGMNNSYKISYKSFLSLFRPFVEIKKQESSFNQVGSLVTRNIFVFCL